MEVYLWWAMVGIALIIAELMTGTFFLLVIGVAALGGSVASYLGHPFGIQAVIAAALATAGVVWVTRRRSGQTSGGGSPSLDVGQAVVLESWVSEKDGLARVRYRNAVWDARVLDSVPVAAGKSVLYIRNVDGNTLHVAKSPA